MAFLEFAPPGYDPVQDKIEIADYDPSWPEFFQKEKGLLQKALGAFAGIAIEHFGSTAVPGLAAKPIIDIMVAVESWEQWPRLIEPIQNLGYGFWPDNLKDNEMFFVKGMPPYGERRTHHVHVYDFQGIRWKKELAFRDYLRAHLDEAKRYGVLKRELAAKYPTEREAYTQAKTAYIQDILGKCQRG